MSEHRPPFTIFLSYSHRDSSAVSDLLAKLRDFPKSTSAVVWDDSRISLGEDWQGKIEQALREANIYLLFITPSSLRSEWANFELGVSLARLTSDPEVTLIPVLLKGASVGDLPPALRALSIIDANSLTTEEVGRRVTDAISRGLKRLTDNPAPPADG